MFVENSDSLTMEEFSKKIELFKTSDVKKYQIIDLTSPERFEEIYKGKICGYSWRGNTIFTIGEVKFEDLDPKYYIWQEIETDEDQMIAYNIAKPLLTSNKIRSSKIYKGIAGTGSHIHYHNFAINFLIKGKKKWYAFPQSIKNKEAVESDGYTHGCKQRLSVPIWILRKERLFEQELEEVFIFEQNAGEVVCIPDQWYHLILNLEDCEGITYSW